MPRSVLINGYPETELVKFSQSDVPYNNVRSKNLFRSSRGHLFVSSAVWSSKLHASEKLAIFLSLDNGVTWDKKTSDQIAPGEETTVQAREQSGVILSDDNVQLITNMVTHTRCDSYLCSDFTPGQADLTASASSCAVGIDSQDTIHVVWGNANDSNLPWYMYKLYGEAWSEPVRITDSYMCVCPSMYIDKEDVIHVACSTATGGDTDTPLRYFKKDGTWSAFETIHQASGKHFRVASLVVDSEGTLHVSYCYYGEFTYYTDILYKSKPSGGSWSAATNITTTDVSHTQKISYLSLDKSDNVYCIYEGKGLGTYTTKYNIAYKKKTHTTGTWGEAVLITDADLDHQLCSRFGATLYPEHNIPTSGCSGLYAIGNGYTTNPVDTTTALYYFDSDDISYEVTPLATECGDTLSVICGTVGVVSNSVSSLSHLEGQTVAILADGEVLDQQVVTGGAITLPASYAQLHVGLPFISDLETTNIEVPLEDGTAQGKKVKIGNVAFRVMNTRGGWVGPNEDTLYEAFNEAIITKLEDDDPKLLFTDDIRVPLGAGYEDGGRLFFRNYDPTPVTINAVVPEVSFGGEVS